MDDLSSHTGAAGRTTSRATPHRSGRVPNAVDGRQALVALKRAPRAASTHRGRHCLSARACTRSNSWLPVPARGRTCRGCGIVSRHGAVSAAPMRPLAGDSETRGTPYRRLRVYCALSARMLVWATRRSLGRRPSATTTGTDWTSRRPMRPFPPAPVSVIVSYYEAPEAWRGRWPRSSQDWPRRLFEVVVVDDGSRVPLKTAPEHVAGRNRGAPGETRVRAGPGAQHGSPGCSARHSALSGRGHASRTGLESPLMPRWHQAVSGVLTSGFRSFVAVDGVSAAAIRERSVPLRELFTGPPAEESWRERFMESTRDLTSRHDHLFGIVVGASFGIRRDLYELAGCFDESVRSVGPRGQRIRLPRVHPRAVVVPVRDAHAFHQGLLEKEEARRKGASARRQAPRVAHLIAHPRFRPDQPGRCYGSAAARGDAGGGRGPAGGPCGARRRRCWPTVFTTSPCGRLASGRRAAAVPQGYVRSGTARAFRSCGARPARRVPGVAVSSRDLRRRSLLPGHRPPVRRALGLAVSAAAALDDGGRVSITRAWGTASSTAHRGVRRRLRRRDLDSPSAVADLAATPYALGRARRPAAAPDRPSANGAGQAGRGSHGPRGPVFPGVAVGRAARSGGVPGPPAPEVVRSSRAADGARTGGNGTAPGSGRRSSSRYGTTSRCAVQPRS